MKTKIIVTNKPKSCKNCEFNSIRNEYFSEYSEVFVQDRVCELTGKELAKNNCPLISLEQYLKEQRLKIVKDN